MALDTELETQLSRKGWGNRKDVYYNEGEDMEDGELSGEELEEKEATHLQHHMASMLSERDFDTEFPSMEHLSDTDVS